ncbi:hypothetical protein ACFO5R_21965 [Halosolutus amylolyticus]|uniref:Uncharacterized protein n=1 Tax=Halosolutus amylolyticus TaxID=2932267 RepID=A0ABD5PVQ8_9EURY|nr:hypothetical protein [Halosolutus amylolyticus]
MTNGPKLRLGGSLAPGLLAVALFGVMALIVVNTPFAAMPAEGFAPADTTITENIGYALLDLSALQQIDSEPFLVSFLLIAVVLDAALDASLVLAKREEAGEPVAALSSTGAETGSGAGAGASTPADRAVADGGNESTVDADAGGDDR